VAPPRVSEIIPLELRGEAETVERSDSDGERHTHAAALADLIPPIEADSVDRIFHTEQQSTRAVEVPAAVAAPTSRPGGRSAPQIRPERRTERHQTDAESVEVHVTIGHVEVRSAPAIAAPAIRRPMPTHLSLTDYLARRNGDSR
jgi:hypothetical protein